MSAPPAWTAPSERESAALALAAKAHKLVQQLLAKTKSQSPPSSPPALTHATHATTTSSATTSPPKQQTAESYPPLLPDSRVVVRQPQWRQEQEEEQENAFQTAIAVSLSELDKNTTTQLAFHRVVTENEMLKEILRRSEHEFIVTSREKGLATNHWMANFPEEAAKREVFFLVRTQAFAYATLARAIYAAAYGGGVITCGGGWNKYAMQRVVKLRLVCKAWKAGVDMWMWDAGVNTTRCFY